MIVSHARQFIFVAVPKTGSQSVRLALRPHLGEYDWEQCGLFEQKRFPVPALAAIGHGHISCQQLQPFLFPEVWQRYRKFAFVRNPFQRFRSLVNFWFGANTIEPDLLGRLKNLLTNAETSGTPANSPAIRFRVWRGRRTIGGRPWSVRDTAGRFRTHHIIVEAVRWNAASA